MSERSGITLEIRVNGAARPWRAGSLAELVREAGRDPAIPGIAIAVNGSIVPRRDWADRAVEPGDDVEIVGAVQGG